MRGIIQPILTGEPIVVSCGGRRSVLELKLRRGDDTEREGLRQLGAYLARLGEPEGFLVLFDRRKDVPRSDKVYLHEAAGPDLQRIYVFGM